MRSAGRSFFDKIGPAAPVEGTNRCAIGFSSTSGQRLTGTPASGDDTVIDLRSEGQSRCLPAFTQNGLFYAGGEQDFSEITSLLCSVLQVPTCAVTLNDNTQQWLEWSKELSKAEGSVNGVSHPRSDDWERVLQSKNEEKARIVVSQSPAPCHAAVPLVGREDVQLGMLCVIDHKPLAFDAEKQKILEKFARLTVEQIELRVQAQHDFLTGALTRRAFATACASAVRQHRRDGTSSALLMFDLDNFKQINDTHGHVIGDQVLKAVTEICANSLRPGDLMGRLGGEEFGIILPDTEFSAAKVCVERMRKLIEHLALSRVSVTASFGLAMVEDHGEFQKWFAAADSALYEAKRAGRNCWATGRKEVKPVHEVSRSRSLLSVFKKGLRIERTVRKKQQSLSSRRPRPPFALFARA